MKHNKLLDSLTHLRVQGIVSQELSPSPTFFNGQPTNEFEAILPDVTQPQCGNNPMKHDDTHHNYYNYLPTSKCTPSTPFSTKAKDSPPGV